MKPGDRDEKGESGTDKEERIKKKGVDGRPPPARRHWCDGKRRRRRTRIGKECFDGKMGSVFVAK